MSHLVNATMTEFTTLLRLVFDTINIKGTLENVSKKSKALRNIVLEEVFYSIYRVWNIYNYYNCNIYK